MDRCLTHLQLVASIPTSGARAVEPFTVDGERYLAIPQLAVDIPGDPAELDGGNSDSAGVLIVKPADHYSIVDRIEAPGCEDAEYFTIGTRTFLAVASIRTGSGPYDYAQPQHLLEWTGHRFEVFQTFEGYAAKQWRHFTIDGADFLALAQGVALPGHEDANRPSTIYRFDGERFAPFQEVASRWGYNWHPLCIGREHYLAYADHLAESLLLRWNGTRFEPVQVLAKAHGRAFADFEADGQRYLLVARLTDTSLVLRWNGERFVPHQELDGAGGREFTVVRQDGELFVIRVNFITGTPKNPVTDLKSPVYRWRSGMLAVVEEFSTTGGTDVATWTDGTDTFVGVSNSLDPNVRFAACTNVYRFAQEGP